MKLPRISGLECVKVFCKIGYEIWSRKGSHVTLRDAEGKHITVPLHKGLDIGTLRSILKEANIMPDRFLELLGKK